MIFCSNDRHENEVIPRLHRRPSLSLTIAIRLKMQEKGFSKRAGLVRSEGRPEQKFETAGTQQ
jgi:hypothetical protein